ncbi:hypothetical protein GQX73_g1480 [Xylaria multiplex]|uniref:BTB domain-containing protein n=1 Tax=Xylaria multiplex TaxID=323545 RepID=A0A7C8IWF4_9PEZI|nr:hypothetical protein GQX73_g1480 [Xylaria multiplex]
MMPPPFERMDKTPEPCISTETISLKSPSGKEFILLARPVAHLSKYFRTALNSTFREASNPLFLLTEHCNDEVLGAFTNWTYLRSSGIPYDVEDVSFLMDLSQGNQVIAWLFGDYIQAPEFQNDIMRRMLLAASFCLSGSILQDLGPIIPEDSRLEKYIVDKFCCQMMQRPAAIGGKIDFLTANLARKVSKKLSQVLLDHQDLCGDLYRSYGWMVGPAGEYEVKVE